MPTLYIALSTADPGEDGSTIAEPSGNGYARVATSASTWDAAASGAITNGAAITFPTATGSWGTITYAAMFDALTSGNFMGSGALTESQAITTDQIARFAAGAFDITLT
jgi:hypothetical protein